MHLSEKTVVTHILKGNPENCDVASCSGHLSMLSQKQDLESSSGAELCKISGRSASADS